MDAAVLVFFVPLSSFMGYSARLRAFLQTTLTLDVLYLYYPITTFPHI